MEKRNVPSEIVAAINALLAPYGESYHQTEAQPTTGFKSSKDAWAYLGMSKSTFYNAVRAGKIHPIKINKGAKNGKTVFATAELEAYIASCR